MMLTAQYDPHIGLIKKTPDCPICEGYTILVLTSRLVTNPATPRYAYHCPKCVDPTEEEVRCMTPTEWLRKKRRVYKAEQKRLLKIEVLSYYIGVMSQLNMKYDQNGDPIYD